MQQIANSLWAQALPGAEEVFMAVLGLAVAWALKQFSAHVSNQTANGTFDRAVQLAQSVVLELEQTVVGDITKNGVPLTATQRASIFNDALTTLKAHLGAKGIAELETIFQPAQLEKMLTTLIEAEVAKINGSVPTAKVISMFPPPPSSVPPGVGPAVKS